MTKVRALLLCDQAFQEAGTGSWYVLGVHDRIAAPVLPAHYPLQVFWSLDEFPGDAMVMVTVRDNVGAVVKAMRAKVPRLPTPSLDGVFPFPPLALAHAGSYSVELQVADQLLAVCSLWVEHVPGLGEAPAPPAPPTPG